MGTMRRDNPRHRRVAGLLNDYMARHGLNGEGAAARMGLQLNARAAALSAWSRACTGIPARHRPVVARALGVTVAELAPDDHLATDEFPLRGKAPGTLTNLRRGYRDRSNGKPAQQRAQPLVARGLFDSLKPSQEHVEAIEALEGELVAANEERANRVPKPMNVSPRSQDVLTYAADAEGNAVLRMVARGSHRKMSALFVMLVQAGVVPGGDEQEAAE